MRSVDALHEFQRFLAARGASVAGLSVPNGIEAMLEFYRSTRAKDCSLEDDGDMLLFQWGPYQVGTEHRFEVNLTRQFIPDGGDDDDIWQLSLTFVYAPSTMAGGNRWCTAPDGLDEFARFVRASAAYTAACLSAALRVELDSEPAG